MNGASFAAVTAYLDALVAHNGAAVPLSPGCWRIENGSNTGRTADEIRRRLADPVMNIITGYRDVTWHIAGDDVIVFYLLDTDSTTVHIAERFTVIAGLIHQIEAVFHIQPIPKVRRWPDDPANTR